MHGFFDLQRMPISHRACNRLSVGAFRKSEHVERHCAMIRKIAMEEHLALIARLVESHQRIPYLFRDSAVDT